jgi:hypothetical protein
MMRTSLVLSLCLAVPALAWPASERPAMIRGVRPLGMGDAFTALADDQNAFFYNPAGSTQRTGALFTLLESPITIGTDLLDTYDFINDNEDKLTDFNELSASEQADLIREIDNQISKMQPHIGASILPNTHFISGPTTSRLHWGLGLFHQIDGTFQLFVDAGSPFLSYDVNSDVVLPVNFSLRRGDSHKVGLGMNLKYIRRHQVNQKRVSFVELEDFDSPPLQQGAGFGADLGALYQPGSRWSFGLAVQDFLGTSLDFDALDAEKGFSAKPARTGTIKSRWNAGLAWTPARLGMGRLATSTGDRLVLALDVKDIFNADNKVLFGDAVVPDTAWKHIHLGAEYRAWFLRLRGGANQGYPTFGLGLDVPFLKLDYAFYSDELGHVAGQIRQSNHMVSLAMRFGSGNTEARGRVAGGTKPPATSSAAVPANGTSATAEKVSEPLSEKPKKP